MSEPQKNLAKAIEELRESFNKALDDAKKSIHALDDGTIDEKEKAAIDNTVSNFQNLLYVIITVIGSLGLWKTGEVTVDALKGPSPVEQKVEAIDKKLKDIKQAVVEPTPVPVKLTIDAPAEVELTIGGMPKTVEVKSTGRVEWPPLEQFNCRRYGNDLIAFNGAKDFDLPLVAVDEDAVTWKWIKVRIKGTNPTPNPDPNPQPDPLQQLLDHVTKNTLSLSVLDKKISIIDARVTALEKNPNPPKPPDPPTPTDPIAKAIQDAFQQEFAPDKREAAHLMAAAYRKAAEAVPPSHTWGEVMSVVVKHLDDNGISGKLPIVAKTINDQVRLAGLPSSPSLIVQHNDDTKHQATLLKVALALEGL